MSASSSQWEVVIVGAGIAGSALAILLARAGHSVVVLEKTSVHTDRVHGEFIVPWGVAEARELGILKLLEDAGGNYTVRSIPYGEGISPSDAKNMPTKMDEIIPGIRGALNIGHPTICNTLNAAAVAEGVTIIRGIDNFEIKPGLPPTISFHHSGNVHTLDPQLIVGADGRGSLVRRQAGLSIMSDPVHHIFTGLLVDGVHEWPSDEQSMGVDDDVGFYVLPQGGGRLRMYLAHALEQKSRFAGAGAENRFLAAMNRPALPCGQALSEGHVSGPCRGYPNNDTWTDEPVAPGVVLIGDAASYSDPAGGQGISSALNDVRLVSESLAGTKPWDPASFRFYVQQRRQRAERTRFSTRLLARYRMEFTPEARRRRAAGRERMTKDPELSLPFVAMQKGPHSVPPSAFSQAIWNQLVPS